MCAFAFKVSKKCYEYQKMLNFLPISIPLKKFTKNVQKILRKFVDDTKLGQTVEKDEDRARLQEALDKLCSWASKWGMVFNVAKCKVMHMGSRNPGFNYPSPKVPKYLKRTSFKS